MIRLLLLALVALLASASVHAQTAVVSGRVLDDATGEPLPGATVYVPAASRGVAANAHGHYALVLEVADTSAVVVRHVGHDEQRLRVSAWAAAPVDVRLARSTAAVGSVEVVAEPVRTSIMGAHSIPVRDAERLPAVLGEVDLVRVHQLLPGVRGGVEGTSGLHVRGGSPDQTLVLLDGAPVYNASHLFGFFSTFNPAAVKHVELTKGSLPARYGGRLASVLSVQMNDGDTERVSGEVSVGLLSTHAAIGGPLPGGRSATYAVSARRTYIDALLRPFQTGDGRGGYHFHDLNAKATAELSDRDRIQVGVYSGRDALRTEFDNGMSQSTRTLGWGNATGTARWTRLVGRRSFVEALAVAASYDVDVVGTFRGEDGESYRSEYRSGLRDLGLVLRAETAGQRLQTTRTGLEVTRHDYRPGALFADGAETSERAPSAPAAAWEGAAYLEAEARPLPAFDLEAGVRASGYRADGGQTYGSVEPRVAARLALGRGVAATASYAVAAQYVHLLANSGAGLPTDLWLPSTAAVGPERGWHAAVGLSADVSPSVAISAEAYTRRARGLLEYRDGAGFFNTAFEDWERQVVPAEGRAAGLEVLLEKRAGRTTGWVAYTLARSERRADALEDGRWFPYRFDRRHDVSVVVTHAIRDGVDLSATWIYGTGDPVTVPVGRAPRFGFAPAVGTIQGVPRGEPRGGDVAVLSARGGVRLPAVHRLDVSAQFRKRVRWGERTITLGLYNAYNRANPAFVDVDVTYTRVEVYDPEVGGYLASVPTGARLVQHALFPTIPSLSYRLRF